MFGKTDVEGILELSVGCLGIITAFNHTVFHEKMIFREDFCLIWKDRAVITQKRCLVETKLEIVKTVDDIKSIRREKIRW